MQDRVRSVGKANKIPEEFENNPQKWLQRSTHPYAPFTGDPLEWSSWVYDDGTSYEGLTRLDTPHGKGVMQMGKMGGGGGFGKTQLGDKYEGEFQSGFAHGLGQYASADGEVYKGSFSMGTRDGCGALYNLKPWKDRIAKGKTPAQAWKEAKQEIDDSTQYGTWAEGGFVSDPTDLGTFCTLGDVQRTLTEADNLVVKARMFEHRPDGQANLHKNQLPDGAPAPTMQHPLHYPHGTLFMAPGPAGQTETIPDSAPLKKLMLGVYANYMMVHDAYNFDVVPASGSLMAKATRWWNKIEKQRLKEESIEQRKADAYLQRIRDEETVRMGGTVKAKPPPSDEDEGGIDDDDLLADAARIVSELPRSQSRGPVGAGLGPSAFGSVTLSISRAQQHVFNHMSNIANRAQPMPRWGSQRK